MFWLAEEMHYYARWLAERRGGLDLLVRLRGLPTGAHAKTDGCPRFRAVSPGRGVSARAAKAKGTRKRARKPGRINSQRKTDLQEKEFTRSTQFFSSLLGSLGQKAVGQIVAETSALFLVVHRACFKKLANLSTLRP